MWTGPARSSNRRTEARGAPVRIAVPSVSKKHAYEEGSLDQYLRDISAYPLISRDDEAELARRIRTGDQEALD